MRLVLAAVFAIGACSPSTAPKARTAGKVASIGGVVGLIATAFVVRGHYTDSDDTSTVVIGFSLLSGVGIATYAAGDLARPAPVEETLPERNHRWARILTQRAYGYARDGRCPRVRHIEPRVRFYDRELHDFVFMRDPEIQKCLTVPDAVVPAPPSDAVQDAGSPTDQP